jgi:hypothetical protein
MNAMIHGKETYPADRGVFGLQVLGHATADAQTADAVLMVRPASFGWNPQTQASNRFQRDEPGLAGAANERARAEFDALALQLRAAGIAVSVAADVATPVCPDAIFPNNWVSLHADGTVVLYPMLARNRRLERRLELITGLATGSGRRIHRLLDLTQHELHGRFLEGTGSIGGVFDDDVLCMERRGAGDDHEETDDSGEYGTSDHIDALGHRQARRIGIDHKG